MKVTELNFFQDTKTVFNFINGINKDDFFTFNNYRKNDVLKSKRDITILINNCTDLNLKWNDLIYISGGYRKISLSIYYFKKETNEIIRVSDHWSITNLEKYKSPINECGSIRSCYWALKINKKDIKKVSYQINIGICKLSKFNKCDDLIDKMYFNKFGNSIN